LYNLLHAFLSLLLVNIFNYVKTVGLLHLISHKFITIQDNQAIFGRCMAIWTENVAAKFIKKF